MAYVTGVSGSTITVIEGGYGSNTYPNAHVRNVSQSDWGTGTFIHLASNGNSYENLGGDFYANIAAAGAGKWMCLENNGGNVQICSAKNDYTDTRQQWHFVRQADGSYRISSVYDGGYMNANRMAGEGTNISVYSSLDWDGQKWYVVKSGDKYQLCAKYDMGLCLDVVNASFTLGNNVQLWSKNGSDAQLFDIYKYDTSQYPLVENLGNDFYANIAAAGNGRSSILENNGGNVQICSVDNDSANPQQQWHFVRQADGSYRISSVYDGGYMNANRMAGEGTNISVYSSLDWDGQKWYVVKSGDKYRICAKYDLSLCLDVLNASFSPGNNVQLWSKNGSDAQLFSISKNSSASRISVAYTALSGISNKTYTGKAITQTPTVKLGEKTLVAGTDYSLSYKNNVNAGTATVTVTGKGNYAGTKSATFKINAAGVSGATVSGLSAKTYTGKAQTQSPTVKVGSATLKAGTDYSLFYKNNVNAGTATVTVTGKGNYAGTKSATFKINAAGVSGATVSGLSAKTYTGKAQTQSPTVKVGSATLKAGTDYTVAYKNNVNAGTATVTVTGKGNYAGTKSATFKINKASQLISAKSCAVSFAGKKSGKKRVLAVGRAVSLKALANVSAKTAVKYTKASNVGGSKIVVYPIAGVVLLRKGLPAGTYKVNVRLTAAESANYKAAAARTITLVVKVK